VFSTWMVFGGNTCDLGSFGEETDEITNLHQILEEVLLTKRGDGVTGIKQCRRDPSSDGVRDLVMVSGRSITTWEDLTTYFLAQFFPPGRTANLRNDILMFQQHHGESLSEAWTRFKDLLLLSPSSWHRHLALKDLSLYNNESWNDPRDFAKPVKAITLPQDVPSTSDRHLIELENQVQRLMEAHLALTQPTQVNKITTSCEIYSGPHDTQYCMEDPEQAFVEYASSCTDEAGGEVPAKMEDPGLFTLPCRLGDLKPFDTLADLGSCVHIGKLKLLNDFYMIDMKKDPETPLLVGRGFLATANAVIDCRKAKIAVGEGITRSVFGVKGVDLGSIPINLKSNMWESEDLIKNPINWDKPPKDGDGAWHAKIRLIDPDEEEFTKTLQSIPTTRKLSERESSREIIDLDHFYDT
ncbi:MAK10-like protein, partial [Tanacetum coccineum]